MRNISCLYFSMFCLDFFFCVSSRHSCINFTNIWLHAWGSSLHHIYFRSFFNPNIKCGRGEMYYMWEKVMLVITWWGSWWWFFLCFENRFLKFIYMHTHTQNANMLRYISETNLCISSQQQGTTDSELKKKNLKYSFSCCYYLVYIHLVHLFKHYSLPIILPLIKEPSFCCVFNIIYDGYACSLILMHIIFFSDSIISVLI